MNNVIQCQTLEFHNCNKKSANSQVGLFIVQDEEKLKNERVRALKAKERFAQSTAGK